jgi:exopolysaccharide biosynthesis operon protein EpsL
MAHSDSGSSQAATGATGSGFPRRSLIASAVAGALLAPVPSWALFGDTVEFWGAYNVTDDNNVLRLSKNLNPTAVNPVPPKKDDTIQTAHLGVSLSVPISQQNVQAEYNWYRSKYRFYKDLDNTGHTARAHWAWMVQQVFTGTLGYNESQGLASFNNIQSNIRDLVTSRSAYWTGNWMVTPRYRASAGLTAGETEHSAVERKLNNIRIESGELGLTYVTPLDNSVGVVARVEHGRLPDETILNGQPFDNEYRQYGAGATVVWIPTGLSRFDGRVEWVRRTYEQNTQRNYSGPIVKALYTYVPSGKLTIAAALSRDVGPADDVQTSFVLVTGGYIRPRWTVSDKVTVQANAEYNIWDYHGDFLTGQTYRNRVRTFGASIAYRPTRKVLLQAGWNREARTSDLITGDYEVDVAFIEGRVGF